jgi:tRNA(Ile)-lysidine synthase
VLDIERLLAHPRPQRARILRAWLQRLQGHPPPASLLATIESDLLQARHDSEARIEWADITLHRWRDQLHARIPTDPLPPDWQAAWNGCAPLRLPDGSVIELRGTDGFDAPLTARARRGGERIRLPGRGHSHALKHVLQERDVPLWIRARLPLLFDADGELLAAGDAILSAKMDAWLEAHCARLRWAAAGPDSAPD